MGERSNSAIERAASRLRQIALSQDDGALLGSEDSLRADLGVSRATMRQVARLLEREGLLRVRRGIHGGYFGARPDTQTIETAVSVYLDTLEVDLDDVMAIASVLWVEVIRKAASVKSDEARRLALEFQRRVDALPTNARMSDLSALEYESREAIFSLIGGRYIQLIFQINAAFAQRRLGEPPDVDDTDEHRVFVREWRRAKLMELAAIADGDPEFGILAAQHIRKIWSRRIPLGRPAAGAEA